MSSGDSSFSCEDKLFLLRLARSAMEAKLLKKSAPDLGTLPGSLNVTASCFVTLHTKGGELRGCIGNIGGFEPLGSNVLHNAVNSAFRDPRFAPVSSIEELNRLEIEISILTAPEKIASLDEFIVGEHGIIIQKGGASAVFLPQVAPEQGWDKNTTLTHLSMKAGMSPDAWREKGAEFSVFRAIVFAEKDFKGEIN
ncbi:MAG: hypothetical protein A2020_07120 [Lentisphaerae bacterium GWF2_45_14]|nr:MAG: hypothetical protein A2020_07120 [Lentisphaerae bacterium GWF2_45_14]